MADEQRSLEELTLVPVGDISETDPETVAAAVEGVSLGPTRIGDGLDLSDIEDAYDENRDQYDVENLAVQCFDRFDGPTLLLIDVDIYTSEKNFLFGVAYPEGHTAIISTKRLAGDPDRVRKQAIKQVGWLRGLDRCDDDSCVFTSTSVVSHLDATNAEPCPNCREAIDDLNADRSAIRAELSTLSEQIDETPVEERGGGSAIVHETVGTARFYLKILHFVVGVVGSLLASIVIVGNAAEWLVGPIEEWGWVPMVVTLLFSLFLAANLHELQKSVIRGTARYFVRGVRVATRVGGVLLALVTARIAQFARKVRDSLVGPW